MPLPKALQDLEVRERDKMLAEIERLRDDVGFLSDLLRQHRCNADGLRTVGECVDKKICGCSCGLSRSLTEPE